MPYTVIDKGSKYFNTITYTGTGASNARTGVGFQPDWVWIKGRSGATDHGLYDAVRGVQKQLESNTTTAETTETTGLTAFGTDGFTVGALAQLNTSSATYVAWNWLGANTTVSNTAGTITSTVSANTTSGFSIVSYTGNGTSNATVGHGLGVTPKMIITRNRSNATATNWTVYHVSLSTNNQITLNQTDAQNLPSPLMVTTVGSSTYTLGSSRREINQSSDTYIAYCFAEVKGFSKFGSYTGNGSTDGTFIYTGFKPAFIMCKQTNASGEYWEMSDSTRGTYNLNTPISYANTSDVEELATRYDYLSNGFKCRQTNVGSNQSGSTYIYMCFASNPFVSSKGIPTTAR